MFYYFHGVEPSPALETSAPLATDGQSVIDGINVEPGSIDGASSGDASMRPQPVGGASSSDASIRTQAVGGANSSDSAVYTQAVGGASSSDASIRTQAHLERLVMLSVAGSQPWEEEFVPRSVKVSCGKKSSYRGH